MKGLLSLFLAFPVFSLPISRKRDLRTCPPNPPREKTRAKLERRGVLIPKSEDSIRIKQCRVCCSPYHLAFCQPPDSKHCTCHTPPEHCVTRLLRCSHWAGCHTAIERLEQGGSPTFKPCTPSNGDGISRTKQNPQQEVRLSLWVVAKLNSLFRVALPTKQPIYRGRKICQSFYLSAQRFCA